MQPHFPINSSLEQFCKPCPNGTVSTIGSGRCDTCFQDTQVANNMQTACIPRDGPGSCLIRSGNGEGELSTESGKNCRCPDGEGIKVRIVFWRPSNARASNSLVFLRSRSTIY